MAEREREADVLRCLRQIALFGGASEDILRPLLPLVRERRYRKDMYVFLEGEPVEAVHVIRSGLVKAATTDEAGREQIISLLRPGDFFPHVGFIEGGEYPATAQAMEDTELLLIRREEPNSYILGSCFEPPPFG